MVAELTDLPCRDTMATTTMSRKKQVLVIEPPEELFFTGHGNTEIFAKIRLHNPSDDKVALGRVFGCVS